MDSSIETFRLDRAGNAEEKVYQCLHMPCTRAKGQTISIDTSQGILVTQSEVMLIFEQQKKGEGGKGIAKRRKAPESLISSCRY